jgi:hypothetical protein
VVGDLDRDTQGSLPLAGLKRVHDSRQHPILGVASVMTAASTVWVMSADRTPPGLVIVGALMVSFVGALLAGLSAATGHDAGFAWALVVWATLLVA